MTKSRDVPVLTLRVTRFGVTARLHKGINQLDDVDWEGIFDRVDGTLEDVLFRVLSPDEGGSDTSVDRSGAGGTTS